MNETYSYSSEAKKCTGTGACDLLAGGENSCEYAEYTYQKWKPRSCNETRDFDAQTEDHDVRLYFTCCNVDSCNVDVDYESTELNCQKSDDFTAYMQELNTCWNDYKYDFMKDLLCDNETGDIFTYNDNCIQEDGSLSSLKRSDPDCRYRLQCAAELQQLLTDYGGCACSAAARNGYTGEFIGSAMEANWQRFCPGIEIECAKDGIVTLLRKYYYARYRFKVAVRRAVIDEAIKAKIKAKIAEKLNVREERISINDDSSSTSRRLLDDSSALEIKIDTDDSSTKNYYQGLLNQQMDEIAADIEAITNGTVSDTLVDSGEDEDTLTGAYEGDVTTGNSGNGVEQYYVVCGFIVAMVSAIYQ